MPTIFTPFEDDAAEVDSHTSHDGHHISPCPAEPQQSNTRVSTRLNKIRIDLHFEKSTLQAMADRAYPDGTLGGRIVSTAHAVYHRAQARHAVRCQQVKARLRQGQRVTTHEKSLAKTRFTRDFKVSLLGASLYVALIDLDQPLTLAELSSISGISSRVLHRLIKDFMPSVLPPAPSRLIFRYAHQMGLTRRDAYAVEKAALSANLDATCGDPMVAVAGFLALHANESVKDTCKLLAVSWPAVRRFLAKYQQGFKRRRKVKTYEVPTVDVPVIYEWNTMTPPSQ